MVGIDLGRRDQRGGVRLGVPEAGEDLAKTVIDPKPGWSSIQIQRRDELLQQVGVIAIVVARVVERGVGWRHIQYDATRTRAVSWLANDPVAEVGALILRQVAAEAAWPP